MEDPIWFWKFRLGLLGIFLLYAVELAFTLAERIGAGSCLCYPQHATS